MSRDYERITLRLSKSNAQHNQAYKTLQAVPYGKRTEYICRLINQNAQFQDLEDIVYRSVNRALSEHKGAAITTQDQADQQKSGVTNEMLDFLRSL